MNFPHFVDIVLHATGYSSPSHGVECEARLNDHNYTNLTLPTHNNNTDILKKRKFKDTYTSQQNTHRSLVQKKEVIDHKDYNVICLNDEEGEGEGRNRRRGEDVRKLHNTLEKKRRAMQSGLMESLQDCLPGVRGASSRWSQYCIINSAITHILRLSREGQVVQREVSRLQKEVVKVTKLLKDTQLRVGLNEAQLRDVTPPRSESHLSNDSGADSGIMNSEDDEQELDVV